MIKDYLAISATQSCVENDKLQLHSLQITEECNFSI